MDFETWFKQNVPDAPAGKYHELLEAWEAATQAERERCLAIAKSRVAPLRVDGSREHTAAWTTAQNIADRIREPSKR